MPNEETDRILQCGGVSFLPWTGGEYEAGFHGRRFLVVGESHYTVWDGIRHNLDSKFTRECVEEVIDREPRSARLWRNLEQALLNEARTEGWAPSGSSLWSKISFYNYVQFPIDGGPGVRPTNDMFRRSHKPFREVLERLQPERVLVCGKGLWNGMEDIPQGGDRLHTDIQAYRLADGTQIWCLATVHPSSGRYSWRRLYPLIEAFLDHPGKAANMLNSA